MAGGKLSNIKSGENDLIKYLYKVRCDYESRIVKMVIIDKDFVNILHQVRCDYDALKESEDLEKQRDAKPFVEVETQLNFQLISQLSRISFLLS